MIDVLMVGPFPEDVNIIKGGVQASVYGLSRALKARGDVGTVRGISLPITSGADAPLRTMRHDGMDITYLNAPLGFLASAVVYLPLLLRALRGLKQPVVHVHGTGLFQCVLLALLRLKRTPCVWTLHGITEKETWQRYCARRSLANKGRYVLYRFLERASLRIAPVVLVDTPYVQREIAHLRRDVQVLAQGIFMQEFAQISVLPRLAPLVVSLGVLDPRKGHHLTLEAFARVRKNRPDARLVIAGAPTVPAYHALLKERIAALGLQACVELRLNAPRVDIIALLGQAQIFALHSQEESQGIALCEALAAGLPVVATRVGGIPFVVEDGGDGTLVEYGDVDAFARVMEALLTDEALRARMSARARVAALRFDWERIANEVVRLYSDSGRGKR